MSQGRRRRMSRPVPNWEKLKTLPNVLDKITGFVLGGETGFADFKSLLLTSKWWKKSALRDCVIDKLNLTGFVDFAFWSQKSRRMNPLFLRLLRARHPHAVYVEAIRLAFNVSEIDAAIFLIQTIKEKHRHTKLLFFCLNRFLGDRYYDFIDEEEDFRDSFSINGMDLWRIGCKIHLHVGGVIPKDGNTFGKTFQDSGNGEGGPICEEYHPRKQWKLKEPFDRCPKCVLHWLARDLVKMS